MSRKWKRERDAVFLALPALTHGKRPSNTAAAARKREREKEASSSPHPWQEVQKKERKKEKGQTADRHMLLVSR